VSLSLKPSNSSPIHAACRSAICANARRPRRGLHPKDGREHQARDFPGRNGTPWARRRLRRPWFGLRRLGIGRLRRQWLAAVDRGTAGRRAGGGANHSDNG
jgi:hypothetical protein